MAVISVIIGAGQFMGEIDLCRLFRFSEPGDYTVKVTYRVGPELNAGQLVWRGEAASGPVYVKITR